MAIRTSASSMYFERTASLPSPTSFSACGWMQRNGTGSDTFETIFSLTGTSSEYVIIYCRANSVSSFNTFTDNGAQSNNSFFTTNSDVWIFWAITCSGTGAGNCIGYARGRADTSLSTGNKIGPATSFTPTAMRLMQSSILTEWTNGSIGAVRVWDAVLTSNELMQESLSYTPRRLLNLHLFTPILDPTTAGAVTDFSENARDWSIGGSPTIVDGPHIIWAPRHRGFWSPTPSAITGPPAGSLGLLGVGR